mgnify:CR=1 FL=1
MTEDDEPIRRRMSSLSDDELYRRGIKDVSATPPVTGSEPDRRRPYYRGGAPILILLVVIAKVILILFRY